MTPTRDDRSWMRMALSLGRRGMGQVWPNPAVGCVIVQGGRLVGRGWTARGGRPHAEVAALTQAGQAARDADVYVTLEPCAHHGQTPPCAEALIAAGVARVFVACGDPDGRVAGRGIAMLREAGVEVIEGVCEAQARVDHAGFFGRLQGRPFVTLKLASTLDGRIATASGESQWITGPEARRAVHAMRARHDAVMVGAGTARADDPMLTVRGMGDVRQPVRVVVSRDLNIPGDGALVRSVDEAPVWLCHAGADETRWHARGVDCVACAPSAAGVDMASALHALADKGLTRVFCEGGGALAGALLADGLVDELIVFSAGRVIGAEGAASVASMAVERLADAPRFDLVQTLPVGGDVMMRWRRVG